MLAADVRRPARVQTPEERAGERVGHDFGRLAVHAQLMRQTAEETTATPQPAVTLAAAEPAKAAPKETAKQNLKTYEGTITFMYQDSVGQVTVGVGHLLSNAAAAQALSFQTAEGKAATAEQIKTDFDAVAKAPGKMVASKYKKYASLSLSEADIDQLLTADVDAFEGQLKSSFPAYDSYPTDVQLGLLDMIFNLGQNGLITKFPSFVKAVKAKNWSDAAKESNRPQLGSARNAYVKSLFQNAK